MMSKSLRGGPAGIPGEALEDRRDAPLVAHDFSSPDFDSASPAFEYARMMSFTSLWRMTSFSSR
ncbi:hypothetical protein D3C83_72770 [compost metagenome]